MAASLCCFPASFAALGIGQWGALLYRPALYPVDRVVFLVGIVGGVDSWFGVGSSQLLPAAVAPMSCRIVLRGCAHSVSLACVCVCFVCVVCV